MGSWRAPGGVNRGLTILDAILGTLPPPLPWCLENRENEVENSSQNRGLKKIWGAFCVFSCLLESFWGVRLFLWFSEVFLLLGVGP